MAFRKLSRKKTQKEDLSDEKLLQQWAEAQESEYMRERFEGWEQDVERYTKMGPQLEDLTQRDEALTQLAEELQGDCLAQEAWYLMRHTTEVAEKVLAKIETVPHDKQGSYRHAYQFDSPETLHKRKVRWEQINDRETDPLTKEELQWQITQEWLHQTGTSIPLPKQQSLMVAFQGKMNEPVERKMEEMHTQRAQHLSQNLTHDQMVSRRYKKNIHKRIGLDQGLTRD